MRALIVLMLLVTTAHAGDASLQIVPTPVPKKTDGKLTTHERTAPCADMEDVLATVAADKAVPIFAGKTAQGEYVQLFRNPDNENWYFLASRPDSGRACSLVGGVESSPLVRKPSIHL